MSWLRFVAGAAALLLCAIGACSDSSTNPETDGQNLLANGSFETDGQPSFAGWSSLDSTIVGIASEPAPGGGDYSLGIGTSWLPPTGVVWTHVPDAHDGDILSLSATVRVSGSQNLPGMLAISVGSQPDWFRGDSNKWTSFNAPEWTQVSLLDTLSMTTTDSVWVVLVGPGCEVCWGGTAYFDLVRLERL
jgi:hypothetical protein